MRDAVQVENKSSLWPVLPKVSTPSIQAYFSNGVPLEALWLCERWAERARMEESLRLMPGYDRVNQSFAVALARRSGGCLTPPGVLYELYPRAPELVDGIHWRCEDSSDSRTADFRHFLAGPSLSGPLDCMAGAGRTAPLRDPRGLAASSQAPGPGAQAPKFSECWTVSTITFNSGPGTGPTSWLAARVPKNRGTSTLERSSQPSRPCGWPSRPPLPTPPPLARLLA